MALKRLGIDFEVVGISEIDKYAIQAYNAVHGETRNYGDISKINWDDVPNFEFFTYSFPCTDISSAGQKKGLEEGSGTRSSLLWECKKAIEAKRPKYLMMENVKALTSKKFIPYLKMWLNYLSKLGYSNYTQVLNAKDYGVPQNRDRVFVVSVLGDESYTFPSPFELKLRLKDVLETNVDESYYLNKRIDGVLKGKFGNKRVQSLTESGKINNNEVQFLDAYNQGVYDVCGTIKTTIDTSCMSFVTESEELSDDEIKRLNDVCGEVLRDKSKLMQIGNIVCEKGFSNPQRGRVYDIDGLSPNIDTFQGGGREPKIVKNYRIRKLTPRECFRLMGVSESDIDKIQSAGISKTQQYKMAGNSIVVDVLYHIFRKLFVDRHSENSQLTLF